MPRVSRKKQVLRALDASIRRTRIFNSIFNDSEDTADDFAEDLAAIRDRIQQKRYWAPRNNLQIPPANAVHRWFDALYGSDDSAKFRMMFRMMPEQFRGLCGLVENHEVFKNGLQHPQLHPRYQLAIFLYYLGRPGGASYEDSSAALGVGEGTISLYSNRVLEALRSLTATFIKWPNEEERKATSSRIGEKSLGIFEHAVGFIDSTHIVLKYPPQHGAYDYFNHTKHTKYALHATVICDDTRRIIWLRTGDTGDTTSAAVHDDAAARVFSHTAICAEPARFFRRGIPHRRRWPCGNVAHDTAVPSTPSEPSRRDAVQHQLEFTTGRVDTTHVRAVESAVSVSHLRQHPRSGRRKQPEGRAVVPRCLHST
ncbi:hypothetical protein BZA05DRAFT_175396 [Tricharina praecox]|uniref:uncharacterized protein n=1 Tax=Tricharina praecox TaxID=43433 RepID=UPI00221F9EDA|nr:uncharacterized protein BZA05DRAFT_175396 [Tricharina praecox]KAI5844098.1 hypothetical protein BZA05DRAFT_175396 [Tricharina praecox]